jgi:hypothetical protein
MRPNGSYAIEDIVRVIFCLHLTERIIARPRKHFLEVWLAVNIIASKILRVISKTTLLVIPLSLLQFPVRPARAFLPLFFAAKHG